MFHINFNFKYIRRKPVTVGRERRDQPQPKHISARLRQTFAAASDFAKATSDFQKAMADFVGAQPPPTRCFY
jgi:hypothetical protein